MDFDIRKRYYVYVWLIKETQEVFYVGKGTGKRYLTKKRQENQVFSEMAENQECEPKIIKNHLTEKEAFDLEKEVIASYREKGHNLINILDGGHKPPNLKGIPKTEEWKEKVRESNRKFLENHSEERIRRSENLKSYLKTEDGRKFLEKSLEARQTDDFRKEQSIRSRRANNTPEYIEKQSRIVKDMWKSEGYRNAHCGANNHRAQGIKQYDLNWKFIKEYETITQASLETGCSISKISAVAKGRRKTTGGYIWKYSANKQQTTKRTQKYDVEKDKCAIPILQYNLKGEYIREYRSISEAVKLNGFKHTTNIICNLKGRSKSAYGYVWKYKHDNTVPSQNESHS